MELLFGLKLRLDAISICPLASEEVDVPSFKLILTHCTWRRHYYPRVHLDLLYFGIESFACLATL